MRSPPPLVLAVALGLACATDGPQTKPRDTGGGGADTAPDTGPGDSVETGAETGEDTSDDSAEDTGPEPDPNTLDRDGDGYTPNGGDCDDDRAHVHPGAPDYCDGLDADCDGEAIPDGSCTEVGDPRVMWSWSFEAFRDDYATITDAVGDVDGDGRGDASVAGGAGVADGGVLFGSGLETWPASGPTLGRVWSDSFAGGGLQGIVVGGDVNADGFDDVWASNSTSAGGIGGVYLMLGREGGFGDDINDIDDAADAAWLDDEGPEYNVPIGAGDLNNDEFTDMLVFANDGAGGMDTLWSLIPGQHSPEGDHQINELDAIHSDLAGNELLDFGEVLADLDGDGFDEVASQTRRTHDGDRVVTFLQGEDFRDGAWLVDVASDAWFEGTGDVAAGWYGGWPGGVPDDVDGDGLNDLAIWLVDEQESEATYCVALLSGAGMAGDLTASVTVSVCAEPAEYVVLREWQDDIDGDGVRDLQVQASRGQVPLPSTRLRDGGVQTDVRTFDRIMC